MLAGSLPISVRSFPILSGPVIHLAGLFQNFYRRTFRNADSGGISGANSQQSLVHEPGHADVHHDAQPQERKQYRGTPVTH